MPGTHNDLTDFFAAAMDRLGPFEPGPRVAVAVSGGADSMALAVLARDWVRSHSGSLMALIVDHGLRAASGDEARLTFERLAGLGVPARVLAIADLEHGSALAERARIRRYEVLTDACAEAGILHLLLGHHAADQLETVAMRVLRGSETHGLAGMPGLRETAGVRLLRPLLAVEPTLLRHFLAARGVGWVEDPSNQDPRALRPRLRRALASVSIGEIGLADALMAAGRLRQRDEGDIAAELARRATIRPEGFALLSAGRISVGALRSLIQTISGAAYPPGPPQISELAAWPKPATVAGVRLLAAGRLGDGMLIVREEAAIGAPVPATNGAIWDRRFRLMGRVESGFIAKLGADAAAFRRRSDLPSAILRTLPAIRVGEVVASVPHLGYGCQENDLGVTMLFSPGRPAGGATFVPAL